MLRIFLMDFLAANPLFMNKNGTIDEVDNSNLARVRSRAKSIGRKNKSKNLFKFRASPQSFGFRYFTSESRLVSTKLKQTFLKGLILHFNLVCNIRFKTYVSGYAISRVLSQLTSDN